MNKIFYKCGYKYQLTNDFTCEIDILKHTISTDFIVLQNYGLLIIKKGYAWDGPSGVAIDTKDFMRGSLVHDALYQLMRNSLLSGRHRQYADRLLRQMLVEDGMWQTRAWWVYRALRIGGKSSTKAKNIKKVISAP